MKLKCLFSKEQIARRVSELATQISHDYASSKELQVICILNGSIFFTVDLLRQLRTPCLLNCIRAKSYHKADLSDNVDISYGSDIDVAGKDVLIIEDIVDTGITLNALVDMYHKKDAASVRVCSFLDKKSRHIEDIKVDYVGYNIEDEFVVGYGMDYNNRYRELPYIGYIIKD